MTDSFSDTADLQTPPPLVRNPYAVDSLPSLPAGTPELLQPEPGPKPQPGILLSLLLTAWFPLSQAFIALPVLLFASVYVAAEDEAGRLTTMMTGSQGGVLLCALLAGAACVWLAKHRPFSLAPMRILHLLALVALVLPSTLLARTCYDIAMVGWRSVTEAVPALGVMDDMNTMAQIQNIVANVPFGFMLFAMAVVPALAEEIIFRGIIGRGLKARYGLVSGIIMTSILFGMAHMHPAHAASVIPLGITMHVLYVATRSFWAPVLFHFCNNAFAVVGASVAFKQGQQANIEEAASLPWWLILACAVSVAAWFYLLSVTRTRLLTADGSDWNPGYESTETPKHIETFRQYPEMPLGATLVAILSSGLFFVALIGMGVVNLESMNQDALILLLR